MKLRNRQGDRVVESQEFFREQGLEDNPSVRPLHLTPDPTHGGYCLTLID